MPICSLMEPMKRLRSEKVGRNAYTYNTYTNTYTPTHIQILKEII